MNTLAYDEMALIYGGLTWKEVLKCTLGTVGSAGAGFLGGAALGTVTLPVIGSVAGSTVGAIAGAMIGAADFCF
jgi:outer membrane lipoprotein SlyB